MWRAGKIFVLAFTAVSLLTVPAVAAKEHVQENTQMLYGVATSDRCFQEDNTQVTPPVTGLAVREHQRVWLDEKKRAVIHCSYPEILVESEDYQPMQAWLQTVNENFQKLAQSNEKTMREFYEDRPEYLQDADGYESKATICQWGRTDTEILSFAVRNYGYVVGGHPAWQYLTYTYDTVQKKALSIDDVVVSREKLLAAVARAFRKQYDEAYVYAGNIDTALSQYHVTTKGGTWQETVRWVMMPDGGLRIFYAPYMIAPFASGEFIVTIERTDEPQLFNPNMLY